MTTTTSYRIAKWTDVVVWQPHNLAGPVALLVGRLPSSWQEGAAFPWPRRLVERGYRVICLNVAGWGNQADVDTIDATLGPAGRLGVVDRLIVIAVGGATQRAKSAAAAAVTWARQHHERVAALTVVGAPLDLDEHYSRVTADQAAMDAAHGGDFPAAAPVFNPARQTRPVWLNFLRDEVGARIRLWWNDDDPVTPPAVTQVIADRLGSVHGVGRGVLDDPDPVANDAVPVVDDAIGRDVAWAQQPGAVVLGKFRDLVNQAGPGDYAWADGMYSIPLPDGRVFWTCGDTFQGPIDPDGSRVGGLIRDAYLVEEADGTLGETIDEPNNLLALLHGVVEGTSVRVIAQDTTNDLFHILSFDTATLTRDDGGVDQLRPELPVTDDGGASWGFHVLVDPIDGHSYIYGPSHPIGPSLPSFLEGTKVARVPTVDGVLAPWEFYTGQAGGSSTWSDDPLDAVFLSGAVPSHIPSEGGMPAVGGGGVIRRGTRDYLWTGKDSPISGDIHVMRGPTPVGPWRWVLDIPIAAQGAPRDYPGLTGENWFNIAYNVNAHPHLAAPGRMMWSHNVTAFFGDPPDPLPFDHWAYGPRFVDAEIGPPGVT